MDNKKINVLVTAVGGRSVGYQILESLKLKKNNYRIITTDMDAFSPGLYEADKAYLLPPANSTSYIPRMIKIIKKEKIQAVLPGSQPETVAISKSKNLLLKNGAIPIVNPFEMTRICFDKKLLYDLLTKNRILTPYTVDLDRLEKAKNMEFPLIIKPAKNSSGSKNVHIVKNINELTILFDQFKRENIQLLAQEYVGSENEEYTVGVMAGKNGQIIDSIVMRRYLTGLSRGEEREIDGRNYVLSTGYSQGFFVDQPDIKKYCEQVAKIVGACGPLNIQCRKGKKGIYIFEVHPRFSGSASIRALVGFNEPHYLIRNFLGLEDLDSVPHKLGYAVMRKFANTIVKVTEYERMKSSK